MNFDGYKYVFLDACFISRLMQIDKTCSLIDFFGPCTDSICLVKMNQYQESPCNFFSCECSDLDSFLSDEEVMLLRRNAKINSIDFTRIAKDPNDIKIFIWGYHTDGAAIWTTDKSLLDLCQKHNISRCCFKAAIKALDDWMNGEIQRDAAYSTEIMDNGDDPFFHYSTNNRCSSHCGLESSCICHKL